MRVKIDQTLCIGCGTCVTIAPNTFELNSEGKAVIKKKDGTKTADFVNSTDVNDSKENILKASGSCPVGAIIVEE